MQTIRLQCGLLRVSYSLTSPAGLLMVGYQLSDWVCANRDGWRAEKQWGSSEGGGQGRGGGGGSITSSWSIICCSSFSTNWDCWLISSSWMKGRTVKRREGERNDHSDQKHYWTEASHATCWPTGVLHFSRTEPAKVQYTCWSCGCISLWQNTVWIQQIEAELMLAILTIFQFHQINILYGSQL